MLKFAGPLAQGVLDLVLAMLAILGVYKIPPRAKRAPPWGDPRPRDLRRRPAACTPRARRVQPVYTQSIQKSPRFLQRFWDPKWFQKHPKMEPKCHQNPYLCRLRFHVGFSFIFGCLFAPFGRPPTHDLTAIYSTFVGCRFFREAWKSNKNI